MVKGEVSVEGNTPGRERQEDSPDTDATPPTWKWNEVGADVVIEATGLFTRQGQRREASAHAGKKVLMSAPQGRLRPCSCSA